MIRQASRIDGKLPESLAAHHRAMKQGWSVEALYALVFAVCVLVALLMLAT
ncbi:MAG TPA: hypothetical protein VM051_11540 [Usitatibacter sp.]|nr:hypothetical protein [Usitatibacter sp.]